MIDGDVQATAGVADLLWAASRPSPDVADVAGLLDAGADAEQMGWAAVQGRTAPLVRRALAAAGRLEALGGARQAVDLEYDTRRAQAALLIPTAVATAVGPLTAEGLEPVIFKGPAVAVRYPAPGLRAMDDIDVLLPPAQHDRGVELLLQAGWRVHAREGQHHDTVLTHPAVPDLPLELHLGLES